MVSMSYKSQKKVIITTFLFFPILFLLVFSYYPAVKLIQQSFTDWDGATRNFHYIGFTNYIEFLKSSDTYFILLNNLAYFLAAAIQLTLGLYFAIMLNSKLKFKGFFKSTLFMPYILNGAAVSYMFNFIFNFGQSPINVVLRALGLGEYAIHFISDSYWTNLSLGTIGIWMGVGFFMVVYLGALQSVPVSLYEVAEIDGAGYFQKLRYITLPSIKTVIELTLFLAINGSMQTFLQPLLITAGGPGIRTETIVSYTIKVAFQFSNFGKASAMGVVIMLMVILLLSLQRNGMKRKED